MLGVVSGARKGQGQGQDQGSEFWSGLGLR